MADPRRLPIYREATILTQQLFDATRKAPRDTDRPRRSKMLQRPVEEDV